MRSIILVLVLVVASAGLAAAESRQSPYSGQEKRAIKARSEENVRGLLAGKGLGYAKSAELNHYPGPLHVLDMVKGMALTAEQQAGIKKIFKAMKGRAMDLGKQIVERERRLDSLFAKKKIDPKRLKALTVEIGKLEGELRAAHLEAHLQTTALLSPHQVVTYDRLRGYGAGGGGTKHGASPGMDGTPMDHGAMHGSKADG